MIDDLIRRQAALDIINHELDGWLTDDERLHLEGVGIGIESIPTADVVERKKGKWIVDEKRFGDAEHHCNLCGAILEGDEWEWRNNYFCYHCGAKMRKETEDG